MILAPLDICPPGRTLLYKRGCDIDIRFHIPNQCYGVAGECCLEQ